MNKKFMDIKELSVMTGVTMTTIYNWVSQRRIPYVKFGRLVKFDTEKINRWIEEHAIEPEEFD